jgi:hypothetical protein
LDQNATSRSVMPQSACTARCSRAKASARNVFWITLSGGCGGLAAFGCIAGLGWFASAGAIIVRLSPSARFISGPPAMLLATLSRDSLRRSGAAPSAGGALSLSLAASLAISRARLTSS